MPRLFPVGRAGSATDPVVDIEKLLVDYAWSVGLNASCVASMFRDRRYLLEVNWSYVDIKHKVTVFEPRHRADLGAGGGGEATKGSGMIKDKDISKVGAVIRRDLCLFRTEFNNSSKVEQNFALKTERTTTSRCEVNLQRGFRIGSNVDVRLNIPSVDSCRVTGSLSGELHVTKATGQTFEEVLTWSVDNQVTVEPKHRATASLLIREEEVNADLTVESVIRALDSIPVYIKCRKTGKVLQIAEIPGTCLPDILTESKGFIKVDEQAVKCETKGVTHLVYGAEQIVDLKTFPLPPEECSE